MSSAASHQPSTSHEKLDRVPAAGRSHALALGDQHHAADHSQNQNASMHSNHNETSGSPSMLDSPTRQHTTEATSTMSKDGAMQMRKVQLLKQSDEDAYAAEQKPERQQLRIQTDQINLNKQAHSMNKWEELIISGRNIQNRSVFASVVHNNILYVYGGYDINVGILADFHKMNLSKPTYMWEKINVKNPKQSPGKLCKTAGVVYKNKMYVVGGQYVGSMNTNRMFCFDFASETWEEIVYATRATGGSGPIVEFPCIDSHRAIVYEDSLIVVSGYLGEFGKYSQNLYQFHFNNKSWTLLYDAEAAAAATSQLGNHSSTSQSKFRPRIGTDVALANHQIFVFGGYDGADRLNDLHAFDIKSRSWKAIAPKESDIPKTRRGHSLNVFGNNLILFGGIHDVTWELDDLFVFDIAANKWVEIDGDSARRKEYSDMSPMKTKQPNPQQRSSFKRAGHSGTGTIRLAKINQNSSPLKSTGSAYSPTLSPMDDKKHSRSTSNHQNYINDPYFIMGEQSEMHNSPTKNLENQKKKEFFQRKADMLASLTFDEQETNSQQRKNSNSPTSEAMKNALITIGNPMPELKVKKGKTTDFGRVTFSKFLEPIKSSAQSKVGKKPCARDGHVAIVNGDKLLIFGGDRHKMSFNDLFSLNLRDLDLK